MGGFGHLRRNASIAQALRRSSLSPSVIMLAEAWQASALPMPDGVDCVAFPAMRRDADGSSTSRFLEVAGRDVVTLRAGVIRGALEAFAPDVLLVDHWPLGAAGELRRVLAAARRNGTPRCVLGLRDVLYDPESLRRAWAVPENLEAIRDLYDAVWIYGDPAVFNAVREYGFPPAVAAKVRYTGYLDQRPRLESAKPQAGPLLTSLPPGRLVLCVVGSGQEGAAVAEAFSKAELPRDTTGVVVTGFVDESIPLIERADRVVTMGGYNTICEMLSFEKHTLVVPRLRPESEQWIRAERLAALGVVEVLHPDQLSPASLARWLAKDLGPAPRIRARLDLGGLTRIPTLVSEQLAASDRTLARRASGGWWR